MLVAALLAAVVATIGLFAFAQVDWPAFNASNVTRALTTVGQFASLAALALAVYLFRSGRFPLVAKLLSGAGLSAFVTVTLGMPLAATKLYLFGISVDQEFRTEYLTRLTDSAGLHDMTYADLPPFYPAGWFWIGGRVANLAGMEGWEVFKPYAIGSIAVAAVIAFVLWSKLIRDDWAVVVTLATTAVLVAYGSPEPYGAVIAILLPPVLLLAWGGLHRPDDHGGWGAIVGTGLFLGFAATFYTLYLALGAFTVTGMAVVAAFLAFRRSRTVRAAVYVAQRLAVAGGIAVVIALVVWLPYLLQLRHGRPASSGTAFHYLPDSGSQLPFPMLHFSMLGALCLVGTIWLAVRAASSRRAQSLGLGVVAIYLWSLASMAFTALGSTLLSFRLEVILLLLLTAAGFFGVVEGARAIYQNFGEPRAFRYGVLAVGVAGAVAFAQDIPDVLAPEINVAYTDTDGNGVRADKRPPGAPAFYGEIDSKLSELVPRPAGDTVVLTADTSFLSYYPYLGFQALTSHYANPLADFNGRAAAIKSWSELSTPDELIAAMDTSPWRAPDAFLFRHGTEGYSLRLAEDVYPNDPNVRRYTVAFPEALFDDPRFTVTEIGPFVLVTRN
ncbi:galactan 5-O-arabinofuranosyltransferase [Antrihabitans sp. YC2-6]|uniref:galactan 5-O-arabinofuranosyltransferase n=1 Tax=Antrihabitans sp. YC2-6 TaxID=2799498 RepID=UPI0018F3ED1F|nr:galactan 5-O-arabinofuranosyltransferase [Antrihabitans sp. YC2-6]MBJ8346233.1 galactan 5-O-arabinofuranosyltransferase [Antrihabitans sp. YC2-6]